MNPRLLGDDRKLSPRDSLIIFGGSLLLLMINVTRLPILDRDEGIHAEVVRELLHGGDWITLHLMQAPWYDKPPLMFWLGGFCWRIFSSPEFALRLAPALFGAAGCV